MKSLFNKYEAQTQDCDKINEIMGKAIAEIAAYCKTNNLSLRDAFGVCSIELANGFAYLTLRQAIQMKKDERS